jgi:hypothetical protein
MIDEEGKAGRKVGQEWSAILVPSPAASNIWTFSSVRALPSTISAAAGVGSGQREVDHRTGRFGPDQSSVIHAQAWASGPRS